MFKIEYLLTCVSEECGEIIQASGKSSRFGLFDHAPNSSICNIDNLVKEVNDLLAVIEMLGDEGVIVDRIGDREDIEKKKEKVLHYMEYSKKSGCLEI